jgi:hypothetical protein
MMILKLQNCSKLLNTNLNKASQYIDKKEIFLWKKNTS